MSLPMNIAEAKQVVTRIRCCSTFFRDPDGRHPAYHRVRSDFESHTRDGRAVWVAEWRPAVGRLGGRRIQVYARDEQGGRVYLFDTDDCYDQGNAIWKLEEWNNSLPLPEGIAPAEPAARPGSPETPSEAA